MSQQIKDIIAKCEEIIALANFMSSLARNAEQKQWLDSDPNYAHTIAIYQNAKTLLTTLIGELP